ncbi:MAG TPA: hypothetical protein VEI47_04500 [Gemmatimonadales bacterium]|nr:hypothetical protein [Gemmatimonadales bacterium]
MPEGDLKARNPALAGLLSFLVPGLGQLYNGQPLLGGVFFASVYGGALLCGLRFIGALGAADPRAALGKVMFWGGLATFVWLGGVVHAVFSALDRAEYFLLRYNHPAVYGGVALLAYVIGPVALGGPVFRWMLAQNGIRTEEQIAQWHSRLAALRGGTSAARQTQVAHEAKPVAPETTTIPLVLPPDPEIAARGAPTAIHLVLVHGPDGGVYDMHSNEPTCEFTRGAEPSWNNLYANPADSLGVTAVQIRVVTDSGSTNNFQVNVNVGNVPHGRAYFIDGRTAQTGSVRPIATIVRRGEGAVIQMIGETAEGVRIEATVRCKKVVPG